MYVPDKEATVLLYDEIPVSVIIDGYNSFSVDIIYTNTNEVYINLEDLFKTLNIACTVDRRGDSISGFIENENRAYNIDYYKKEMKVGSRLFDLSNSIIKESGSLYIESSLFRDAFGISLTFNYRSLSINLKSDFELPLIKKLRIEKMRINLNKLKGVENADTIVKRNYHLIKPGILDWSLTSIQTQNGKTDNYLGIGIGTEFLYGEVNVSANYSNRYRFEPRQLQYLWRWVDNDKKIIKQAQVGKTYTQSIAFLTSPVVGATISNSPVTVRKATGYHTINEYTEPNWTVELYINNVLVDYTQADASGLYQFKVPIVYGYTTLKLKFYGPMGEERSEERTVNVPYTFIPAGEFEYGISGGVLQDSLNSRFARGVLNYGITRILTLGGGLEYLSSISTGASIPFAMASFQPLSRVTLSAEYAYGVRTKGVLNYYFMRNAFLEIQYSKYREGQRATVFNANEERRIRLSVPFKVKSANGFAKIDYTQLLYSDFYYNQSNLTLSIYYKQISANSTTQLNWVDQRTPSINTDLALSLRIKNGFSVRPSVRYNVNERNFITAKAEIEKRIPKGYFSISYEKYFVYNDFNINLNFKYDLPFAKTNASVLKSKNRISSSESIQGSLMFGGGNNYTHVSNNSLRGKGGLLLFPFLDLNQNGVFDSGESLVKLNSVKISGGKAIFSEKDSLVRIPDLNSFTSYKLEFDNKDLENIAWRFKYNSYQVLIDPNQFKRIDIPVVAIGEANGMCYIEKKNSLIGTGRILIKFYRKDTGAKIAEILSESDGYINFMGFSPGNFIACVDSTQLNILGVTANPACREFTVKPSREGDIISGIGFILRSIKEEESSAISHSSDSSSKDTIGIQGEVLPPSNTDLAANTQPENVPEINFNPISDSVTLNSEEVITRSNDYNQGEIPYSVQLGAFRNQINVNVYFSKLYTAIPGQIIKETFCADGLYRYTLGPLRNYAEAKTYQQRIKRKGWTDCFVVKTSDIATP